MSRSRQPNPSASDDDVAGLFRRLGPGNQAGGYQDFSSARLKDAPAPAPAVPAVAPPAPAAVSAPAAAVPVAATPAPVEAPASAGPVVASAAVVCIDPSRDTGRDPGRPLGRTSLERLFQRLVEAGPQATGAAEDSPLKRLRGA